MMGVDRWTRVAVLFVYSYVTQACVFFSIRDVIVATIVRCKWQTRRVNQNVRNQTSNSPSTQVWMEINTEALFLDYSKKINQLTKVQPGKSSQFNEVWHSVIKSWNKRIETTCVIVVTLSSLLCDSIGRNVKKLYHPISGGIKTTLCGYYRKYEQDNPLSSCTNNPYKYNIYNEMLILYNIIPRFNTIWVLASIIKNA